MKTPAQKIAAVIRATRERIEPDPPLRDKAAKRTRERTRRRLSKLPFTPHKPKANPPDLPCSE